MHYKHLYFIIGFVIHHITLSSRTSHRNAASHNFTRGNDSRAKSTREEVRSESDRTSCSTTRRTDDRDVQPRTHDAFNRHSRPVSRAREICSRFESATGAKVTWLGIRNAIVTDRDRKCNCGWELLLRSILMASNGDRDHRCLMSVRESNAPFGVPDDSRFTDAYFR